MMQLIKKSAEKGVRHKSGGFTASAVMRPRVARPVEVFSGLKALGCIALASLTLACAPPAEPPADEAPYRIQGEQHFVSGFPTRAGNGLVNMVVEIPAGTQAKWEVSKEEGSVDWELRDGDYRMVQYLPYVGNYGMLPRTLLPKSLGGDGDQLDILLLGAALPRGTVVAVRPVGVLRLLDRGEQDDKIIAVPIAGPMHEVADIEVLEASYAGVTEIIEQWFVGYKGPGKMESRGYAGREAALQMVEQASAAYEAEHDE